jgi:putative flippase GtrA
VDRSTIQTRRPQPSSRLAGELRSFVLIGLACTAAYAALYTSLRDAGVQALLANLCALLATMGVNFVANRRFTFAATGRPVAPQLTGYALAYGLGLGASTAALAVLLGLLGHPHGLLDTAAGLIAGLFATVVRFVLMRNWVFRPAQAG